MFFDGAIYTIVCSTGEQVRVEVFDSSLNVGVFLGDGRDVSGLLGNGDGAITNEFELRDGTPLGATLDFAVLYGAYADDWRISDATSLFTYGAGGRDRIKGGGGNDTIFGGDADDDLFGNGGNDLIEGGDGNDLMKGGDGDDTLIGGPGDDMMWGNGGSDTFVFSPGDGFDKIRDFKVGVDLIDLSLVTSITGFDDLVFSGKVKKVIVDYGDGEVLLAGVKQSDLEADSFIFARPERGGPGCLEARAGGRHRRRLMDCFAVRGAVSATGLTIRQDIVRSTTRPPALPKVRYRA